MSMTSPPPKARQEYRIGQVVDPVEKPKVVVRPSRQADSSARGPRGIFTNGTR